MKDKYDAEYKFGNTAVYVVAPKITVEENLRQKKEVNRIASMIIEQSMKDWKYYTKDKK